MEFLDIFNKDKDEEVELKPGERGGYGGFSRGPAEEGSSEDEGGEEEVSRNEGKEARLFPGLGKKEEKGSVDRTTTGTEKKAIKRVENKMDKILKQNKMILEKLEGLDSKSSKSSDENTVW